MAFAVVGLVSLGAAALTLFSGFGLGTLLLPAFAVFFPAEAAVALTALVHLANNAFKLALVGRWADRRIVLLFGVPALVGAFAGAALLVDLARLDAVYSWELGGRSFQILPVKAAVAALMLLFVGFELGAEQRLAFPPRAIPLGGLLSGFFGGLSGHQGALRSCVLVRSGLSKEAFIGTGVVAACLVDVTRLSVYAGHLRGSLLAENKVLLAWAAACAFAGSFLGARLVEKVTMAALRNVVAVLLAVIALLLGSGII